jgi:hypothetical protein
VSPSIRGWNGLFEVRRLIGTHNPTGTTPSFVLPVFMIPPHGNALYLQQISSDAVTVSGFEILVESLPLQGVIGEIDVTLGGPAIHAFELRANERLVGTQAELVRVLEPLIDAPALLSLPLLRLDLVDFCNLTARRKEIVSSVYNHLRQVSTYSAIFWRDRSYLTTRARRIIWRYFEANTEFISKHPSWWNSIALTVEGGRPILGISHDAAEVLERSASGWSSRLAKDLRGYFDAFELDHSLLQVQVKSSDNALRKDGSSHVPSGARESFTSVKWILVTFGKIALTAGRDVSRRHRGTVSAHLSLDVTQESSVGGVLREIADLVAVRAGGPTTVPGVLLICDSAAVDIAACIRFARRLPELAQVHGVMLYRTRDGIPTLSREFDLLRLPAGISGLTVICDNDTPLGESSGKTPLGAILSSLLQFFMWQREEREGKLPEGVSLFSMGRTRHGIRHYPEAISRGIAAMANPWLPLTSAGSMIAILKSVGRPPAEFESHVARQLNQIIGEGSDRLEIDARWSKRRFMPGASIPATFEVFARLERRATQSSYLDAAKIMLRARGFQTSPIQAEGHDTGGFRASLGVEFADIMVLDQASMRVEVTEPHVLLMESVSERQSMLKNSHTLTSAYPLLLGDLFFLNGERGPLWAARVLARMAYPKQRWKRVFGSFLEEEILNEVRENPGRHFNVDRMPKNTRVASVSLTITQCQRLRGRRALVRGFIQIRLDASGRGKLTRLGGTQDRMVEITLGPDEFRVE